MKILRSHLEQIPIPVVSAAKQMEVVTRITSYNVCYTKLLRAPTQNNSGSDHAKVTGKPGSPIMGQFGQPESDESSAA